MKSALKKMGIGLALLGGLSGLSRSVQAQVPAKTVVYYADDGQRLPSAEGADHRVETTYRDTVAGTRRRYYASGKLQAVRPYGNLRYDILHGAVTTWYESGQMHTKEDYRAGKRHGELLVYYPDGRLRRRDQFDQDQRTAGECWDATGQPVPHFEYQLMPAYTEASRGKTQEIVQLVARSVRYPEEAVRQRVGAKIYVAFEVNKQGQVRNARLLEGGTTAQVPPRYAEALQQMQQEALRAVRQLKPMLPGKLDGEVAVIGFTLPVTFRVE